MKLQCDFCSREEASVFCSADEAALCHGCDSKVHHANMLASKHHRFSLLHPSSKEAPLCDICKERRAFVFCREDRAILCRECDLPIHTANHLSEKHSRFLLTGIKLSSSSFSSNSSPPAVAAAAESSQKTIKDDNNNKKKKKEASAELGSSLPTEKVTAAISSQGSKNEDLLCTSSFSQYLMETLPGWHVEDLLASPAPAESLLETDGFLPFTEAEEINGDLGLVSRDFSMWVPQVPPNGTGSLFTGGALQDPRNGVGLKRRWTGEKGFTVPEMSPPFKRSRPFWQIG